MIPNLVPSDRQLRWMSSTIGDLVILTELDRFFDWSAARALVAEAGFREMSASADGGFPLARFLPGVGRWFSRAAVWAAPGLFGWQFVIVAAPLTGRPA